MDNVPLSITALHHYLLQNLELKVRTCLFHKFALSTEPVQITEKLPSFPEQQPQMEEVIILVSSALFLILLTENTG